MSGPAAELPTWKQIDEKISAILRGLMFVTLQPSDGRKTNQDALDLKSETLIRILSRLKDCRENPQLSPILDPLDFAAKVTYNVYYDYWRKTNAAFSGLKNALLYFFDHQSGYATWQNAEGTALVGRAGWRDRSPQTKCSDSLDAVVREPQRFFPQGVPRFAPHMGRAQWKSLVDPFLKNADGPVPVNDLVKAIAAACGVDISMDKGGEDDPHIKADQPDTDDWVMYLAALRQLWVEIQNLELRKRQIFLLNPPRGTEIDVFPEQKVATVEDIAAAVGLTEQQYLVIWSRLELTNEQHREVTGLRSDHARFHTLWSHLPLKDSVIAAFLGITQQQVINLRMLAVHRLEKQLSAYW